MVGRIVVWTYTEGGPVNSITRNSQDDDREQDLDTAENDQPLGYSEHLSRHFVDSVDQQCLAFEIIERKRNSKVLKDCC